jgi:hypothetical protein
MTLSGHLDAMSVSVVAMRRWEMALRDGVDAAGEDVGAYEGGALDAFGCDGVAAEVLL